MFLCFLGIVGVRRGHQSSRNWSYSWFWCWESNFSPLETHPVLLISESFLQSTKSLVHPNRSISKINLEHLKLLHITGQTFLFVSLEAFRIAKKFLGNCCPQTPYSSRWFFGSVSSGNQVSMTWMGFATAKELADSFSVLVWMLVSSESRVLFFFISLYSQDSTNQKSEFQMGKSVTVN